MGNVAAAVREFERVKIENPKFATGRLHLGLSYYAQGRRTEAASEWQQVLVMAPENKSAHMYLAMVKQRADAGEAGTQSDAAAGREAAPREIPAQDTLPNEAAAREPAGGPPRDEDGPGGPRKSG